MKKSILIISLLFFFSSSVMAFDSWTIEDKALAATMSTLVIIDWGQTINITRNPSYHEVNPLLGPHPSGKDVNLYMGSAIISSLTIAYLLPSNYRKLFMGSVISLELPYVYNNHQIGLRVQF